MFVGHYAVALAARPQAPSVSLGTLFVACQLSDLLWPNLVLLGIEKLEIDPGNTAMTPLAFIAYPYSHSLVAVIGLAVLAAVACRLIAHASVRAAVVVAAVVFSHWLLDALTHRPDLPLTIGGSARVGLGLWNLPVLAISLELLMFAAAAWYYVRTTRAADRQGSIGFWALIAFLTVVYLANVFGPPPPSVLAVAWSAQAMWLLVLWAYWVDRHREPVSSPGR